MKEIFKILIIALIGGLILFLLDRLRVVGGFTNSPEALINVFIVHVLYMLCLVYSNYFLFKYWDTKISWNTEPIKRIVVGFITSVFVTILVFYLLLSINQIEIYGSSLTNLGQSNHQDILISAIVLTIVLSVNFHLIYFYKYYNESKTAHHKLIAHTESAKFETLKNQIDPHFLFNSLNVLASLIGENQTLAEKFTTKLSKVYRYVLEQKDKELAPLEEELNFAKTYMDLLKIRFEDAIIVDIQDKIDNDDYKIVPLSLQLLLENAIKHNIVSSEYPLTVNVYTENGFLIVSNSLNLKSSTSKGTKVGLSNIVNRYALLTNKQVEVLTTTNLFEVKIPLLTKKIIQMKTDFNEQDRYYKAKKRVEDIKGFYGNLLSYIIVIPFLIFINLYTSSHYHWFWFPLFGWGVGLTIHGFSVFGYNAIFGSDWEERKIKEFMEEENKKNWE